MTRRMSCSMTVDAVRAQVKTVTRRHVDTWKNLRPGDRLILIEKGMGLPKGAKQVVLAEVEVVDVRDETLRQVNLAEVIAEGLIDRAVEESAEFAPWYEPEVLPVQWFRALWASGHLGGTLRDWMVGRCAASLMGQPVRRIEWRYLDSCEDLCMEQCIGACGVLP